jgi:hypothetical protein
VIALCPSICLYIFSTSPFLKARYIKQNTIMANEKITYILQIILSSYNQSWYKLPLSEGSSNFLKWKQKLEGIVQNQELRITDS